MDVIMRLYSTVLNRFDDEIKKCENIDLATKLRHKQSFYILHCHRIINNYEEILKLSSDEDITEEYLKNIGRNDYKEILNFRSREEIYEEYPGENIIIHHLKNKLEYRFRDIIHQVKLGHRWWDLPIMKIYPVGYLYDPLLDHRPKGYFYSYELPQYKRWHFYKSPKLDYKYVKKFDIEKWCGSSIYKRLLKFKDCINQFQSGKLTCTLHGIVLRELEKNLMEDFTEFVKLYDKEEVLKRKNFLNYKYVLFQLLQRHEYECQIEDFPMIKTIKSRLFHDRICSNLFKQLGWNFTERTL